MLIRGMREGGESKIILRYTRGSGTSHQFFRERGGIFSLRGVFVSN